MWGEDSLKIKVNDTMDVNELNDLLKTIGWGVSSSSKLEESLKLSWGWITARDELDRLIGFVQILSDGIKHAYILRLIVHKDFQGNGVGTKIMEKLMEVLEENNLSPILLTKPSEESFYSKFGLSRSNKGFISLFKW